MPLTVMVTMNPDVCDSKALALHHYISVPLLESQQACSLIHYSALILLYWALGLVPDKFSLADKTEGSERGWESTGWGWRAHNSAQGAGGLPRGSDAELRPEGEAGGPWNSPRCGVEDLHGKRTRVPTLLFT